jgi:stage II sporulation protein D
MQEIHLDNFNGEPIFRIGIVEEQDYIDFYINRKFSVIDSSENILISGIDSSLKWRVKIKESTPGAEKFHLILFETYNSDRVKEQLEVARTYDSAARIETLGGHIYLGGKKINDNTKYIILSDAYESEIDAKKDIKRFMPEFNPTPIKMTTKEPKGILEFFDAEYENSGEVKNSFKVVPADVNSKIRLYGIRTFDPILQKEHIADRVYNGTIEFRIDNKGKLMLISEIPLETYLKRVVYSEIGTDLPVEFSKSLAIVSRSEVLARVNHKHIGEPYDMCDWGHCLRYYGQDFEDEIIETAVENTRGQVIYTERNITDTYFNLICGGHTEDAAGVWEIEEDVQFKGRYDWKEVPKEFSSLQNEKIVRKWILSRPDAWCNLRRRNVPASLEQYKKYFRWEVNYTRKELEDIIRKKTGEDIGVLFDIVPLRRGRSGRLKEIELIGSLKNYRIRSELTIRESLSLDYLESSCFTVEKELDDIGTPISFTLIGAGQGHGVGMCKTGGAVMALEGYKWEDILKHYFQDCKIRSIYE